MHLLCQTEKASVKAHAVGLLLIQGDSQFDRTLRDTRPSRIDKASVAWMTGRHSYRMQVTHVFGTRFAKRLSQENNIER